MSSFAADDAADAAADTEELVTEMVADAAEELEDAVELVDEAEEIAEDAVAEEIAAVIDEVEEIAEELAEAVADGEITEDEAVAVLEAVVEEELEEIAEVVAEAELLVEVAEEIAAEEIADAVEELEVAEELAQLEELEELVEAVEIEAELEAGLDEALSEDDLLESAVERPQSPYDRPGSWFVVHTQSGYEKKVKQNLEARISSMNMEERIHEVVIPMEDVVEFKNGKKVVVQKKVFPGYLLVRCNLDDDSWYVIRNTPGVTGFVGQGAKPSPLPRKDVESFLSVQPEGEEAPKRSKPKLEYELHETVRVKEGPFADFSGEIVEINEDQLKVKVLVNIFGRETPVELEFSQVAKL